MWHNLFGVPISLALYLDSCEYQNMKCKLCLKESQSVKSHIIPEFMYEGSGLYDEKHRFFIIEKSGETPKFQQKQKGLAERLLCQRCEIKISRWEDYARRTIYGPRDPRKIKTSPERVALFDDVDYKRFKLFLLSMLWRISISGLPEFRKVRLGRHEEKMRKMLYGDDPGSEDDYGCLITSVIFDIDDRDKNENLRKFMLSPESIRTHGHICYRVFIGGSLYIFVVSKHRIPAKIKGFFLNRSNQLPVLIRRIEEVPLIAGSLLELQADIKQRRFQRRY